MTFEQVAETLEQARQTDDPIQFVALVRNLAVAVGDKKLVKTCCRKLEELWDEKIGERMLEEPSGFQAFWMNLELVEIWEVKRCFKVMMDFPEFFPGRIITKFEKHLKSKGWSYQNIKNVEKMAVTGSKFNKVRFIREQVESMGGDVHKMKSWVA